MEKKKPPQWLLIKANSLKVEELALIFGATAADIVAHAAPVKAFPDTRCFDEKIQEAADLIEATTDGKVH